LPCPNLLIPVASQEQGPELKAFSANLSNGTLDKHEPAGDPSSMQRHQSSTTDNGLHSQNSALSWSQRQQLRHTSAAMRHAGASHQLLHQENRVPPGWFLPSLLALVRLTKTPGTGPLLAPLTLAQILVQASSQRQYPDHTAAQSFTDSAPPLEINLFTCSVFRTHQGSSQTSAGRSTHTKH